MATKTKTKYLMHTTANCPYCQKAKKLFDLYEVDVEYISKKSIEWPTFPAIYSVNDDGKQLIGGFTELVSYSQKNGL